MKTKSKKPMSTMEFLDRTRKLDIAAIVISSIALLMAVINLVIRTLF